MSTTTVSRQRRLRLIAVDGKLIGPPPPPPPQPSSITSIGGALAVMRVSAAIIEAEPIDPVRGYSLVEFDAQHTEITRFMEAFRVLDRLLSNRRPQPTRKPTRNGATP